MLKHVGKQGERKVAIVFREVPGEEHMALVVYPDIMPRHLHDSLMSAIESREGQSATNLGDAIHGKMFSDGRPMLTALHTEGMLKKVRTESIILSPNGKATIRLDELNKLVKEMESGDEARAKLAEADANAGYTGTVGQKDDFGRDVQRSAPTPPAATANGALDDTAIAQNLKAQADRMAAEAKGLLAESERMMKEAADLLGEPAPKPKTTRAKAAPKAKTTTTTASRKAAPKAKTTTAKKAPAKATTSK